MTTEPTIGKRRSPHFWEPYSWAVRVLVERGYGVSESVRKILEKGGVELIPENRACLRVRYYAIKNRPWPKSLGSLGSAKAANTEAQYGEPEPERFEDAEGDLIDEEGAVVGTTDVDDFEV